MNPRLNVQIEDVAPVYACVYLRELPAQALLRLRPELRTRAVAVLKGERPWERVCSMTRAAGALGVERAMTRPEVEAFDGVTLLPRSAAEEQAACSALAGFLGVFTPRIEPLPANIDAAWMMDLGGTARLFGEPQSIAARVQQQAQHLGLSVEIAISANFECALALARVARGRVAGSRVMICAAGDEARTLAPLPLAAIRPEAAQAETLATWGLKTLGELAALPETDLIARLGQAGKQLRRLARGEADHHFQPAETPLILEEFLELDDPVETQESLLFCLNPMLEQVLVRAMGHALALQSVEVAYTLEKAEPHVQTIRPALPSVHRAALLKLLQLDLEARPPQAAVLAIRVTAEPGPQNKLQLGLFSPQMPEAMQLDITLARIAAIVGEERVGCAELKDTHHADEFVMKRFVVGEAAVPRAPEVPPRAGAAAVRRLRPAQPVAIWMEGRALAAFFFHQKRYRVEQSYGPWQKSGEWWSGRVWSTETWDVVARAEASGELLTCVLAHDLLRDRWLLEAIYD